MTEIWRPLANDFGHWYEVSDLGHVRRHNTQTLLKASAGGVNRRHLSLKLRTPTGQTHCFMLAHLVAAAFLEDPQGRRLAYRDGNPQHCAVTNLLLLDAPWKTKHITGKSAQYLGLSMSKLALVILEELLPETWPLLKEKGA